MNKECTHKREIKDVTPQSNACQECGSTQSLRVCMECGHVGCCESQQAHNTKHSSATSHLIIKSMPLNDRSWTWCYECKAYV